MFPQQSPQGAVSESGGRSGTTIWVVIVVALAAVPAFVPPNFEEVSREYRRNLGDLRSRLTCSGLRDARLLGAEGKRHQVIYQACSVSASGAVRHMTLKRY
jgi:hypothetical protein